MDERHPSHDSDEVEDIKPDIIEYGDKEKLSPAEAVRRELETYGDSSAFPNREDSEDAHQADPDEHL